MVELSKHSLIHCLIPLSRVQEKAVPCPNKKTCRNLAQNNKKKHEHKSGEDYEHPCPECNEKFTSKDKLWKHARENHPDNRRHKCDICGQGFLKPGNLSIHRRNIHAAEIPCPECNERFTTKGKLWKHARENHPDYRMYKCEICGQGFFQSSALGIHRRNKHTVEKPNLECNFCGKTFGLPTYLKKHINHVHTKCRKYKCPHCSYATTNSTMLSQHIDIHFGKNRKKCPYCGCLKARNVFKKHIEEAHEGKRYK